MRISRLGDLKHMSCFCASLIKTNNNIPWLHCMSESQTQSLSRAHPPPHPPVSDISAMLMHRQHPALLTSEPVKRQPFRSLKTHINKKGRSRWKERGGMKENLRGRGKKNEGKMGEWGGVMVLGQKRKSIMYSEPGRRSPWGAASTPKDL